GSITMYKKKDFFFGLVFLWAYTGILLKHLQKSGFNGNYLTIIITVMVSILILLYVEYNIYQAKKDSG
ncbi:MAG TPA: tryptophan-rich sensory protein, partial [Clostridia bacterium]|nr:tryptophan-rich sensory protein [Clostridia bacterium]